jgi:glycosyltransferase involved in cell wall biosynthesis
MKRIVIDGMIFGLQKAGGISQLWGDLLLELDTSFARKYTLIVLIPTNSNIVWKEIHKKLKNIRVVKRKRFRWGRKNYFNRIYLSYLAWKWRPMLWHQSYYVGFPSLYRVKKLTTFHDMIPEMTGSVIPYDSKMKYDSLKECSKAVVISQNSNRDLLQFLPECEGKTVVIPNGCAQNRKDAKKTKTILFVGKRRGYKNFLSSVKALLEDKRFDSYEILAAGGESPLNEEELSLERVEYLGPLSASQMQEAYAKAEIVLFPSLYEGFGLPLIEAFSAGCLVLAMRSSSIPEIVGEVYPLGDPKDSKSLSEVAALLLKEKEKWISYGHERRELFTIEKMGQKMCEFYQKEMDQ